ncbi:MAG: lactate utilization protein [Clostridia bacterium]|nr:lactate utilization protein [Clostridia bacterium]
MDFTALQSALEKRGYRVSVFATGVEAARYLDDEIDGQVVGFGGSMTLRDLGLYDRLLKHNAVLWHSGKKDPWERRHALRKAMTADVYLSSVNGIAETGEIVNIDGIGNRVAGTLFGHKKVYFVVGRNKVAPTLAAAIDRARNVAAPKNAARLGKKTPCVVDGRCHDCSSPDRICRELAILWQMPMEGDYEVVLIDEDLGF